MTFGRKIRNAILEAILGSKLTHPVRKLGVYDTAGKRRYWTPLPSPHIKDGKLIVAGIPTLVVDETFTIGWLQIDDENDNMLVKVEVNVFRKGMTAGDTLVLSDVTLKSD